MHVTPRDDGWAVQRQGASRASRTHRTQAEAAGRRTARREQTELLLHGRIRERDSYGNDPHPPSG